MSWTLESWREKMPVTQTRFEGLGLTKIGTAHWQFLDMHDLPRVAQVGQHYRTKMEALADLDRYARENWGY